MNEIEFDLACDLAEHKLDMGRLRAENAKLRELVSFFACAIKSGDEWSPTCERMLREALKE